MSGLYCPNCRERAVPDERKLKCSNCEFSCTRPSAEAYVGRLATDSTVDGWIAVEDSFSRPRAARTLAEQLLDYYPNLSSASHWPEHIILFHLITGEEKEYSVYLEWEPDVWVSEVS